MMRCVLQDLEQKQFDKTRHLHVDSRSQQITVLKVRNIKPGRSRMGVMQKRHYTEQTEVDYQRNTRSACHGQYDGTAHHLRTATRYGQQNYHIPDYEYSLQLERLPSIALWAASSARE
ncbi:MAG: hypothetical protein R3B68_13950 [Phycisphaerales bacterium]